ncbi:MAG: CsgG/HfaB family protein [Lewinellaceae bacterium]|nr:CsgG/HfaB family protein [Phaeodactylibacter sp.]MCB9349469.1 CsgG/HfaB family protein [Lewinellaceae bacterium]
MKKYLWITVLVLPWVFSGCGAYLNQPMKTTRARLGEETPFNFHLRNLPKPEEPIIVAVYKLRDQTGQYKPSEIGTSWSTAVTQGATNILIKTLMDSGWFTVIERENVGNLLNERKIIRSTRMEFNKDNAGQALISPLLFAGMIIEGGIVSYESNIMTGGIGVRYFGAGGSGKYRQDRVTVYLRAIATKSGRVLKNVYTSKTLLSQAVDGGLFRFVKFSRLLEVETGFTYNEPADMAVTEAIEKAVYSLILEGAQEGLWRADDTQQGLMKGAMAAYEKEKEEMEDIDLLGRESLRQDYYSAFSLSGVSLLYQGDYPNPVFQPGVEAGITAVFSKSLSFHLGFGKSSLASEQAFDRKITYFDGSVRFRMLPNDRFSPFLFGGGGLMMPDGAMPVNNVASNALLKINAGLGLEYFVTDYIGLELALDNNYIMSDGLDGVVSGKYNDFFYRSRLGVKYYLGRNKKK